MFLNTKFERCFDVKNENWWELEETEISKLKLPILKNNFERVVAKIKLL